MSDYEVIPLGMDAKLYVGVAGATATTEVEKARDVSLGMESEMWDATSRKSGGVKSEVPTLMTVSVEWDMLWQTDDPVFQTIRNAFLTKAPVALMPLDSADGEGPDADFSIVSFSRNEPVAEGITVAVTARVRVWREWHEAA